MRGFVVVRREGSARPAAVLQLPTSAQIAAVARRTALPGLRLWVPAVGSRRAAGPRRTARRDGAGTPIGDLRALLDGDLPALERTVERIAWVPRDRRVREALRWRAAADECDVASIKRRELRAAAYLVLAERGRPQAHRFGARWLVDEQGRARAAIPEQLPDELFWRWFADEARKAAEASLLGRAYPGSRAEPGVALVGVEALEDLPSPDPDPLRRLVEGDERRELAARWRGVVDAATPAQRALLGALVEEPSVADAARRLGIAASTARVQWKRVVDRHRPA